MPQHNDAVPSRNSFAASPDQLSKWKLQFSWFQIVSLKTVGRVCRSDPRLESKCVAAEGRVLEFDLRMTVISALLLFFLLLDSSKEF